jgi:hypothetical protein
MRVSRTGATPFLSGGHNLEPVQLWKTTSSSSTTLTLTLTLTLTTGTRPNNMKGDQLFFHYSGHGGTSKDRTGEEVDGMNETLIPVDAKVRCAFLAMDSAVLGLARVGCGCCTVRVFRPGVALSKVPLSYTPLLRVKLLHACGPMAIACLSGVRFLYRLTL